MPTRTLPRPDVPPVPLTAGPCWCCTGCGWGCCNLLGRSFVATFGGFRDDIWVGPVLGGNPDDTTAARMNGCVATLTQSAAPNECAAALLGGTGMTPANPSFGWRLEEVHLACTPSTPGGGAGAYRVAFWMQNNNNLSPQYLWSIYGQSDPLAWDGECGAFAGSVTGFDLQFYVTTVGGGTTVTPWRDDAATVSVTE